jgi:hypothetical protein
LIFNGFRSGGDSWTRTNGLPSVGQIRNRRADALERHLHSLLTNKLEALSPSANSPLG